MDPNDSAHELNRLAAFVEHRLDATEARAVADHLADCGDCRSLVALIARGDPDAGVSVATASVVARRWLPVAAAATLAVTAGSVYMLRSQPSAPMSTPSITEPAAPAATRAPSVPAPMPSPSEASPSARSTAAPRPVLRGPKTRVVGTKRFRLVAGEWIDLAYDPAEALPVTAITTDVERDQALAAHPGLNAFVTLGPFFTVVFDGAVYRFDLPHDR